MLKKAEILSSPSNEAAFPVLLSLRAWDTTRTKEAWDGLILEGQNGHHLPGFHLHLKAVNTPLSGSPGAKKCCSKKLKSRHDIFFFFFQTWYLNPLQVSGVSCLPDVFPCNHFQESKRGKEGGIKNSVMRHKLSGWLLERMKTTPSN